MKHFEDVWREAEKVANTLDNQSINTSAIADNICMKATDLLDIMNGKKATSNQLLTKLVGAMLFDLAIICNKWNINSWEALVQTINEKKIDLNDKSEVRFELPESQNED